MRIVCLAVSAALLASPAFAQDAAQDDFVVPPVVMSTDHPDEEAVEPHPMSNANADAIRFEGTAMLDAFHGQEGISRIVEAFMARNLADPRIAGVFEGHDHVRTRRLLKEQFGYILGAPIDYTGRDMASSHADLGIQTADMGALVENLQIAMSDEGVAFPAQNRFLAKLAPMKPDVVTR
ncbi:MAG: group 1 truncated hemoglobin [Pseudomonadota bacterium]